MIRKYSSKEKYGLYEMNVGQSKKFGIALYSKLRQACHYAGKRWDREYSTRKATSRAFYVYRVK